jgi:hypothetical protein
MEAKMATRFFGERIKRNGYPHLLAGNALSASDVKLPIMAPVAFAHNPHAWAWTRRVNATGAREREGVKAICTPTSQLPKSFPIHY